MDGFQRRLDGHDAYVLLGVAEDASADEIRRAFRARVRRCHPDAGAVVAQAAERVRRLTAARDVLLQNRAAYDRYRGGALTASRARVDEAVARVAAVVLAVGLAVHCASGRPDGGSPERAATVPADIRADVALATRPDERPAGGAIRLTQREDGVDLVVHALGKGEPRDHRRDPPRFPAPPGAATIGDP